MTPYEETKKHIAEIKQIQQSIEKLYRELWEIPFGFNPNKILEKK